MPVKHLNSPLFQRRYLRKDNDEVQITEPVDAASNQINGAANEDSENGEQITAAAITNGSKNEEATQTKSLNDNLPGEEVNGINTGSATLEETSVLGGEETSLDTVNGDNTTGVQNVLSDGDESQPLRKDPVNSDGEATNKQDGETSVTEASERPEQERLPDEDDDDDDEGGRRDSEILEEPVVDEEQGFMRQRYELSYWPYHLVSAEKLWTAEERENSNQWKELWKLVIQFLCESPDAFRVWQQRYMELGFEYEVGDTLLSPLQVAAAYSLPGLVKILLERGELAAAETEDGRSALWFGAILPDIEVITLLLENGAKPNAHKDFLTPFNNLLRWSPKLEYVNLMLEHGADCNTLDLWGSNALHWFALSGSDVEVLKTLLKANGNINVPDAIGETPLHLAMYRAEDLSLDLLRVFLENGADVNKDDNESQSKPL